MTTEAAGAISGAKAALELAKGISSLKSETDKNQAIIDIQRVLLEIQEAALNDKQRISDLQDKIADLQRSIASEDDWQKIKARYRLTESSGGAFTYNLIDGLEGGEAPHRLCVTCFEDRVKSVLHVTAKARGGEKVYCSRCDKEIKLSPFNNTVAVVATGRSGRYSGDW